MTTDNPPVLVTGASGFIAKHIVVALIQRGYTVRGSVRSDAKAQEVRMVLEKAGADPSRFEHRIADLTADDGWPAALAGCRFVLHTASPFPASQPREKFALVPQAHGGTLRVLEAAERAGVERVVLTSSVASVGYGHGGRGRRHFDEATFSNVESGEITPYAVSKTEAERAAWDRVAGSSMDLVTINPALVLGPVLDATLGTSATLVSLMMRGKLPALPDLAFGVVDVRDVAEAHVRALDHPDAAGRRFLLSAGNVRLLELAEIIRQAYPERRRLLPRRRIPSSLIRLAAAVSRRGRMLWAEVGTEKLYDSTPANRVLGMTLRTPQGAILALADSLIEVGRA